MPLRPYTGVLEVVVAEVLDVLAEPDGLLRGPDAVRVETEAVAGQRHGERAVALELVLRREDPAFQLVAGEAVGSPRAASAFETSWSTVRTSPFPVLAFA